FAPDGKSLAACFRTEPDQVRLCDPKTGDAVRTLNLTARAVRLAYSADSTRLAVTERDNAVRVYDTATGRRTHEFKVKLTNPYENFTAAVAVSPDGKTVAAGATDNGIYRWDLTTGKE